MSEDSSMLKHESTLHSSLWLNNSLLYGYTTFVYLLFQSGRRLGWLYFLAVMNNAAMNIRVPVFVLTCVLTSSGYIPSKGILFVI